MKKRIRHGDPRRRSYWEEVVRRWREGGQSGRVFCCAEELRESAFYFWRHKLCARCYCTGKRVSGAVDGAQFQSLLGDANVAFIQAGIATAWCYAFVSARACGGTGKQVLRRG